MFGYVTVGNNRMTEDEYAVFLSYYCGVCKATGKIASQMARLGLSYDITFLALVLSSLDDDDLKYSKGCVLHPAKKRKYVTENRAVEYAAAVGVVLTYLKLKDDWDDDKSIKALLGMMLFYRGCKRAKKNLNREFEIIKKQLDILSGYEKAGSDSVDDTSEAFGKILECLFAPDFIEGESQRRVLSWLGLNLGKWIYLIDAVNDFEADLKSGSYNPLIKLGYRNFKECASGMELGLTLSLDGIASAYELADIKKNKEIIGKIIYISLKEKQKLILSGNGKDRNGSVQSIGRFGKCRRRNRKESI